MNEMYMTCEQKNEVNALIEECRDMGFRSSSEVSHYIRDNRLGYKYQHISGYLTMSDGRGEWEFEGGIAPQFYAYICKKLELRNNGSHARVEKFESYAQKGVRPTRRREVLFVI